MRIFDRLLFQRFRLDVRSQAMLRLLFAGLVLAIYVRRGPQTWLADLPFWFFLQPAGPAEILPLPSRGLVVAIHYCILTFAFLLFIGWRSKAAALALTGLLLVERCWLYSFGKVDHDILFVLTPAVLAFSRWGDAFSFDAAHAAKAPRVPEQSAWPFAFLAILIAAGMFNSGLQKALGGWLDISSPATLAWIIYFGEAWGRDALAYRHVGLVAHLPPLALEST